MINNDFIKILKDINKKIIMGKNTAEVVTYICAQISKIENETNYANEYIEGLEKDLK